MAAPSLVKVKKEDDDLDLKQGPHSHQFKVKFPKDIVEYTIDCDQPRSVLDAIKSDLNKEFTMMVEKRRKCTDEKIIIQLSKKGKESIVATHFPCSCIENDECLTIHCKTEQVEETKSQHDRILPRDRYSVFYISTQGGENTRKKTLFRSKTVKQFNYLCVYAEKGTTVKDALKRDGRFVDLEDFKLSEHGNKKEHSPCTQKVDNLDQRTFNICLPRETRAKGISANKQANGEQQGQPSTSKQSQQKSDTKSVLDKAKQSGISVKRAMEETGSEVDIKEIYDLLCKQYPRLKEWMESRFTGKSYQKELKLKKENFGKIQQSFSEVHRVEKLLELGKSVCLLKIEICNAEVQGTGFVLYDNLILTNAHLFEVCDDLTRDQWKDHVKITAEFNYKNPDSEPIKTEFKAQLCGYINALDYAILELDVQSQRSNQTETEEGRVPPGLLSKFGPPPKDGAACVIGHPAGGVKKMDPTCIIAKEEREQAVNQNLQEYRDYIFTLCSINQEIRNHPYADVYVTYNSFMYHGSSGSPVFDAHGRVFGLHSGGFVFGSVEPKESVIEYSYPLLNIFGNFVDELWKVGHKEQLERVQVEAKGNPYLEQIIESVVELRRSGHEGQLGKVKEETQESESLTEGLDAEEDMDNS